MRRKNDGVWWVVSAYAAWGILPIFWSLFADIDPVTVLVQRTIWSSFFLGTLLLFQKQLLTTLKCLLSAKNLSSSCASSFLLALNWFSYLWAMKEGDLFTASIAYYICPLMTLAGATLLFKEKISKVQRLSLAIFALGVSLPLFLHGTFPWLASVIGGSWSGYVLLRRSLDTTPLVGTFRDTLLLTLLFSGYAAVTGQGEFLLPRYNNWDIILLFSLSGIVTAAPMVWLVKGMRTTPLSHVGILQYLAPTLTLCCSMGYFHQHPTLTQIVTLLLIWAGLVVYFSPHLLCSVLKMRRTLSISPPPVA